MYHHQQNAGVVCDYFASLLLTDFSLWEYLSNARLMGWVGQNSAALQLGVTNKVAVFKSEVNKLTNKNKIVTNRCK